MFHFLISGTDEQKAESKRFVEDIDARLSTHCASVADHSVLQLNPTTPYADS